MPTTTATATTLKKDTSDGALFGKTRYKFWVLAAILLLAFWSMFTGSVTLKWSTGNLSRLNDDLNSPIRDDDLDILVLLFLLFFTDLVSYYRCLIFLDSKKLEFRWI